MVTNSISGTKVFVSMIVKSAPADASRNARIAHGGVENMCMAQCMFYQTLFLIEALCGEHVPCMFGYEIRCPLPVFRKHLSRFRDIHRPLAIIGEVVEGIDIFQKLAAGMASNTSCLPIWIEPAGELIGLGIELMIVLGFVDTYSP